MNAFSLVATLALNAQAYEKGLEQAEKDGEGFGSKLKNGLGNAMKVVGAVSAAAVAAGASALVSLTKSAVSAYADYEQLLGGVEKLFGDASEQVTQNASNAYKTAGLSANEYMETVTSFSASLIAALDGDTAKAAAYADQAISDMADNANTFGTSMESIQSAYQGFAKQNYTMLDNLKLGYGGTKEEMERLVQDADALSDSFAAQYDESGNLVMSYADIVEAIHIVQENMNIAGTTAKEADKTISGSIASTKAAWQNLIAGLGNPSADVKALASSVISSAKNVVMNVVPIIRSVISVIPEALSAIISAIQDSNLLTIVIQSAKDIIVGLMAVLPIFLQEMMDAVMDILPTLIATIADILPALISVVLDVITQLISNLGTILEPILAALPEIITTILDGLASHIGDIVAGLVSCVIMILDHLPEIIQALIEAIPEIIIQLIAAIVQNLPTLIVAIIQCIGEIALAVWDALGNLWNEYVQPWLDDVFGNIGEWFANIFSSVGEFFANIWNSVVEGCWNIYNSVTSWRDNIINTVAGFISNLIGKVASFFSSIWSSITTWFSTIINKVVSFVKDIPNKIQQGFSAVREAGLNLVRGLWNGISDAAGWVLDKIKGFGQSILDGIKSIFGIASPSKAFAWIGEMLDRGLAGGVDKYAHLAINSAEALSDGINDAIDLDSGLTDVSRHMTVDYSTSASASRKEEKIDRLIELLEMYLPGFGDKDIYLDSGELVGGLANKIDASLNRMSIRTARGMA